MLSWQHLGSFACRNFAARQAKQQINGLLPRSAVIQARSVLARASLRDGGRRQTIPRSVCCPAPPGCMALRLTVRTLVAEKNVELEADAGETVGAFRERAEAVLQQPACAVLCLGTKVKDTALLGSLQSTTVLLLPRARKARNDRADAGFVQPTIALPPRPPAPPAAAADVGCDAAHAVLSAVLADVGDMAQAAPVVARSCDDSGPPTEAKRRRSASRKPRSDGADAQPGAPPRANDPRRCRDCRGMGVAELLEHLRSGVGAGGLVAHVESRPARAARYAELPPHAALPPQVSAAFGTSRRALYTHQAAALSATAAGRHVAVSTSTSSGKSACFQAPCLAAACAGGTSLLLFPTKALAQDQLRALRALIAPPYPDPPACGVYDGDTPEPERAVLRRDALLLLTNPDMVHCGILPSHAGFARFLSRLAYVVIDEAHAYGGAFGSHTALVLRRLRRVAQLHGSEPRFIFASATVANPVAHASALAGLPPDDIALADDDGSPAGARDFVLWNPPLLPGAAARSAKAAKLAKKQRVHAPRGKAEVAAALLAGSRVGSDSEGELVSLPHGVGDAEELSTREWIEQRRAEQAARLHAEPATAQQQPARMRASPIFEVALLLAEAVQHGLSALAFCKSRKLSELVFVHARELLSDNAPELVSKLAVYRAGYSPEARRGLERRLFSGELRGVAATNALELGVDVGSLDVVISLGFPGSIASLWQQSGRAGRREQRALHIYVAFEGPLDAGIFANPSWLFSRPPEAAAVNPHNARLLAAHVACAAYEAPPLHVELDLALFGPGLGAAVEELRVSGCLGRYAADSARPDGAWAFIGAEAQRGGPARGITLRAVDDVVWTVMDEDNTVVESIEASKAFYAVYEGAVLLHQGRSYLCWQLDHRSRIARVRRADLAYYTAPCDTTLVTPAAGCAAAASYANLRGAQLAPARVTTRVHGFTKRMRRSGAVFDFVQLQLPETAFDTVAAWVRVPQCVRDQLPGTGDLDGGLHAAGHALANVLPLFVTCAPTDVATECGWSAEHRARPMRLLVYDRLAGGCGVAASAHVHFPALLQAALELLERCPCTSPVGCIACVQSFACCEYNAVLDKQAALACLRAALADL